MKTLRIKDIDSSVFDNLKIDCPNCCGICCAALYYAKSEGFPSDKPAGQPCGMLSEDFSCSIHEKLASCNLKGCMAYDCLGAGQKVTQNIYKGKDWRSTPQIKDQMFQVFLIVYQLHQMLWYLTEALTLTCAVKYKDQINILIQENEAMTRLLPEEILMLSIDDYRFRVNDLLKRICTLVKSQVNPKFHSDKASCSKNATDYMGKNFKKTNLDGHDFSMAFLIASNLEGCSLFGANFLGADLRDATIKNVDLRESVFLTQEQINTAIGNSQTMLPPHLTRPSSWQK